MLSWDHAYAYVTSGLHTYFSDISISIRKWKRFLFPMLMSLPVYTAYVLCLCLYLCRSVNQALSTWRAYFKFRERENTGPDRTQVTTGKVVVSFSMQKTCTKRVRHVKTNELNRKNVFELHETPPTTNKGVDFFAMFVVVH